VETAGAVRLVEIQMDRKTVAAAAGIGLRTNETGGGKTRC